MDYFLQAGRCSRGIGSSGLTGGINHYLGTDRARLMIDCGIQGLVSPGQERVYDLNGPGVIDTEDTWRRSG